MTAGGEECPYSVIGVARDASMSDIKASFREQMKRNHPDAALPASLGDAEAATKRLNAAMDTINTARKPPNAWRHPSTGRTHGEAHERMSREQAERMYRTRQPWRAMSTRTNLRLRFSAGMLLLTLGFGSKLAEHTNVAKWAGRPQKDSSARN